MFMKNENIRVKEGLTIWHWNKIDIFIILISKNFLQTTILDRNNSDNMGEQLHAPDRFFNRSLTFSRVFIYDKKLISQYI